MKPVVTGRELAFAPGIREQNRSEAAAGAGAAPCGALGVIPPIAAPAAAEAAAPATMPAPTLPVKTPSTAPATAPPTAPDSRRKSRCLIPYTTGSREGTCW